MGDVAGMKNKFNNFKTRSEGHYTFKGKGGGCFVKVRRWIRCKVFEKIPPVDENARRERGPLVNKVN